MKKNLKILLFDILDSIEKIEEYIKDITEDKFFNNLQTQDAVVRRIEIIGEAVKSLPISFKEKYSDIPWRKIAGTRDVVIHNYSDVDVVLVWEIAKREIPVLKKQIFELLKKID